MLITYLWLCFLSYFFINNKINKISDEKMKEAMIANNIHNLDVNECRKLINIAMIILLPLLPIFIIIAFINKNK